MPIINPTQIIAGTEIDAEDVNTPINQIANLINGDLSTDNIADNAITSPKLAPASILPSHLGSDFDYSTDEVDTGRKWIDGKTIYRICVTVSKTVQSNANDTIAISSLPAGAVVLPMTQMSATDSVNTGVPADRLVPNGVANGYGVRLEGNNFRVFNGTAVLTITITAVIYYTKN